MGVTTKTDAELEAFYNQVFKIFEGRSIAEINAIIQYIMDIAVVSQIEEKG